MKVSFFLILFFLIWYAQLDVSWISHAFIYDWLLTRIFVCCCHLMMFYDWRECVMNLLGTTKQMIGVYVWWMYLAPHNIHSAIELTLGNKQTNKNKKCIVSITSQFYILPARIRRGSVGGRCLDRQRCHHLGDKAVEELAMRIGNKWIDVSSVLLTWSVSRADTRF